MRVELVGEAELVERMPELAGLVVRRGLVECGLGSLPVDVRVARLTVTA